MSLAEMIIHQAAIDIAERLIRDRLTCYRIKRYTQLDDETIQELAFEMGVVLPGTDFRRLVPNSARQTRADESEADGR